MTANETFLIQMRDAAKEAGHLFPEYAACEAALETAWGTSYGYSKGWNVFGNKQRAKPVYQTLNLSTWESRNGRKVNIIASFIRFPDVVTAFKFRMETLNQYQAIYRDAVRSKTGEQFVRNVSGQFDPSEGPADPKSFIYEFTDGIYKFVKPRWATDEARASKVLEIYEAHKAIFIPAPVQEIA